ncbi:MAG: ATP-binding cassette domain-containing protein [Aestuariivita sp.]|nr:ATP-binding cassette domain-containing protein [Aestuariivita sp.]
MTEVVLETHALTMRYGGVTATKNVDFKLYAYELRCLIGPNGAGKSTFFKCISGLETPTDGEILMLGSETTFWTAHQIASLGVGIKTQVPNVMDGLTVFENIWLAARRQHNTPEANRKTEEILDRLTLRDIAHRHVGHLAHGERQHVELGLVAVGDPKIVLLDEPAAGMSSKDIEQMTKIIHELNKAAAIIIVEHDMQFIQSIANRVTVFHRGEILIEDHVDRVMSDPTVRNVYLGKKS